MTASTISGASYIFMHRPSMPRRSMASWKKGDHAPPRTAYWPPHEAASARIWEMSMQSCVGQGKSWTWSRVASARGWLMGWP